MFELCSEIVIGGKHFRSVNNVVIKRSLNTLGATAVIKIPVTSVLIDKGATTQVETAQTIALGEKVEIKLGYNGELKTEFRGWVKMLNYKVPLEIECEDEFYRCRDKSLKHSGKTTLKELLQKCDLKIARDENLTIAEFPVPDRKANTDKVSSVLSRLKKKYLLSIYFDLDGLVHAHGTLTDKDRNNLKKVKYEFLRNTISEDELKYHNKKDVKVKINAVAVKRDGTTVEVSVGEEEGTEIKLQFYDIEDENSLRSIATSELERRSFDGYRGTITTFLQPYAEPGMAAVINDPIYPERGGNYLIESVETSFGTSGARRKIEIGQKV